MILLYLDTETTGLDVSTCSIWQLSGYIGDTAKGTIESFDYKLHPYRGEIITEEAVAKTGVTQEELDTYPPQSEAFTSFLSLISKYVDLEDWNQRVIPVGYYASSLDEALLLATMTAEVTHNHPEGIKGARAVAAVIWMIRNGWSKNNIKSWICEQFGYDLSYSYDELKRHHKFECICQRSVPAAIICWLNADSYEDGIRKAVSLGGDADTEAALTGAFLNADENTEVSDDFAKEVTRFFSMDFMDILNKFHNAYENK